MFPDVQVVRLCAWESRLTDAVAGVRAEESELNLWCSARVGLLHLSGNNAVDWIAVGVFAVYTLALSGTLTPSKTFAVWVSLLHILHAYPKYIPQPCDSASPL